MRALDQLRGIYSQEGRTLEVRQQMLLGDEAFGSIRIGVSTVLMRQELNASLRPALNIALASLLIAVIVAALLAQLFLRPINVIRSGLTRLGKGEFGVTLDLPQDDEFGELGTFFNTVSQQLSADRSLLAGQKANLQSAVEHLEDAVALFNPSGELLFSNPAMQPTLPADAIGRALRGLLPDGDPYRTIVEETLATRTSCAVPCRWDRTNPDALLMTHAIEGTDGQLVGVLLVSRNLAYSVAHAVDDRVFAKARGARAADRGHRARGEEPAQRDDDSPRAAADQDPPRHGARGGAGRRRGRQHRGSAAVGGRGRRRTRSSTSK